MLKFRKMANGWKRKRLDGGGRRIKHPEQDKELAEWIKDAFAKNWPISRRIIRYKAVSIFKDTELVINGQVES